MAELTFTYDKREYSFDPERDLKVSQMRHIEQWYPDLDGYFKVSASMYAGDPDAVDSMIWVARNKAGDTGVPEAPRTPEYAVGELIASIQGEAFPGRPRYPRFKLTHEGKDYELDFDAATNKQLKYLKKNLPQVAGNQTMLVLGFEKANVDALACCLWLARKQAGDEEVHDPRFVEDFSVGELLSSVERIDPLEAMPEVPEPPEEPPNPTEGATPKPRSATRRSPRTSGSETSDSSDTSTD